MVQPAAHRVDDQGKPRFRFVGAENARMASLALDESAAELIATRGEIDMANDVFLSYRRTDQSLARALVAALEARGVKVWWDDYIEGGEDWRDAIVEGLTNSAALVILFSNACNTSKQLRKELAIADTLGKVVVPVLIEETKPRGHFLYELSAINWLQIYPDPETKLDGLADRLVRELGLKGAAPGQASTAESRPTLHRLESPADLAQANDTPKPGKGARDYLPYRWYEILTAVAVGGLAAMFSAGNGIGGYPANPYWDGTLFFLVALALIGILVFPFRYYFRGRDVWHAARYYFFSTLTLGFLLGALAGIHPDFLDDALSGWENLLVMIVSMIIIVAFLSMIAFGIYGLLRFQRAVRSFRRNVQAVR